MGAFSAEIGQCRPPGEPGVKTFRGTPWKRWLTNNKLKQSWRLIHVTWPQNPQNKHGIKCVGLSHREGRSHSAQTADSTVRGLPGACPWGGQRENQAEPGRRSRGGVHLPARMWVAFGGRSLSWGCVPSLWVPLSRGVILTCGHQGRPPRRPSLHRLPGSRCWTCPGRGLSGPVLR